MGNRRLGAKRLNAVAKRGEQGLDLTHQAGAGIKPAVVSHRVIKRGGLIETHLLIDLQGDGTDVVFAADTDRDVIGCADDNSGTNAVADASLMTYTDAVHGQFREITMQCLEVPTGGANVVTDIGLVAAAGAAKKQADVSDVADDNAKDLINPDGAWTAGDIGQRGIVRDNDPDGIQTPDTNIADGDRLYLVNGAAAGGAATNYTGGKFLIVITGADETWGF